MLSASVSSNPLSNQPGDSDGLDLDAPNEEALEDEPDSAGDLEDGNITLSVVRLNQQQSIGVAYYSASVSRELSSYLLTYTVDEETLTVLFTERHYLPR
jgi:hypothetical protein